MLLYMFELCASIQVSFRVYGIFNTFYLRVMFAQGLFYWFYVFLSCFSWKSLETEVRRQLKEITEKGIYKDDLRNVGTLRLCRFL